MDERDKNDEKSSQELNDKDGPSHVNSSIDEKSFLEDFNKGIDGDGTADVSLKIDNECDGGMCNAANYKLISMQQESEIDLGLQVHVPHNMTASERHALGLGLAAAIGPNGDPDGDGLSNSEDYAVGDPQPQPDRNACYTSGCRPY